MSRLENEKLEGHLGQPATNDMLNDWGLRLESSEPGAWRALVTPTTIAGIIFAVLYALSYWMLANTPLGSATDAEIIAY